MNLRYFLLILRQFFSGRKHWTYTPPLRERKILDYVHYDRQILEPLED